MIPICGAEASGDKLADWIVPVLLVGLWLAYGYLAIRRGNVARHAGGLLSWTASVGLLLVALWPSLTPWTHYDLRGHMTQHLLIGMVAPLGFVLARPLTLVMQTIPTYPARRLMRILRSRPVRVVSHPLTAGVLNVGGLYLLYLTPLYATLLDYPAWHPLVHFHFLGAGCLFVWSIARPDPVAHCPSFSWRLGVLLVSLAAHACLSKLMYAYGWPSGTLHPPEQIRQAAQWMYYGGDGAEALLAAALFVGWYRKRGRQGLGRANHRGDR